MKDTLHLIADDLADGTESGAPAEWAAQAVTRLESLLGAHAAFGEYLRLHEQPE